ncbi:MAG: copper-binding protein [Alphaproteobacteria bacterium]|nr:copper-binding protein [Alphaproteobacteria bacterium]
MTTEVGRRTLNHLKSAFADRQQHFDTIATSGSNKRSIGSRRVSIWIGAMGQILWELLMLRMNVAKPSAVAGLVMLVASAASAGPGPAGHGHGSNDQLLGEPGDARRATRTVRIELTENSFKPKSIQVRAGETIVFDVVNKGSLLHEFSFAPPEVAAAHRPEMAMMFEHGMFTPDKIISLTMTMPGGQKMDHTQPNSVIVEPGKSGRIVWKFTKSGALEIACNIPGHFEAGMVGDLKVNR